MTKINLRPFSIPIPKKIVTIISVFLLVAILFDPFSFAENILAKYTSLNNLANAKRLWENKGITSYRVKVNGFIPLNCLYDAKLTFHEGELVDVQVNKSFSESAVYVSIEKQKWTNSYCDYTRLSILEKFSDAREILERINPLNERLEITFDPTYGFITHYQFQYNNYGLLTSRLVSDCCAVYKFSDFHPIK